MIQSRGVLGFGLEGNLHFHLAVQQEFENVPWVKWALQRVAGLVLLAPNHSRGLLTQQEDPGGKRPWWTGEAGPVQRMAKFILRQISYIQEPWRGLQTSTGTPYKRVGTEMVRFRQRNSNNTKRRGVYFLFPLSCPTQPGTPLEELAVRRWSPHSPTSGFRKPIQPSLEKGQRERGKKGWDRKKDLTWKWKQELQGVFRTRMRGF